MLSDHDLQRLEGLRLERFSKSMAVLRKPSLVLDANYDLLILCGDRQEVEALEIAQQRLCARAWIILGCTCVSVWLDGEEMWSVERSRAEELESSETTLILEKADMGTQTLEKPTATSNGKMAQAEQLYTIEQIADWLSGYAQLPSDQLIPIILETRPLMQYDGGTYKIPASAGLAAFRQWASNIESQLESGELPSIGGNSNGKSAPKAAAAKPKATAKPKTTAKKATTSKRATTRKASPKTEG